MELSNVLIRMRRFGSAAAALVGFVLLSPALIAGAGLLLISYGVGLAWVPGGFITLGAGLLAEAIWARVEEGRNEPASRPPFTE